MTNQPPIERPWDPPKQPKAKQPWFNQTKWIVAGVIGAFILFIFGTMVFGWLTKGNESPATSTSYSPVVGPCNDLSASQVEELNFTLDAYANGESITTAKVIRVKMEGAGTLPYVAMIAAKLNKAGTVALWAQGEGGFIVPLNGPAISAMPDAAAEGDAVTQALNSAEGQAVIKCAQ